MAAADFRLRARGVDAFRWRCSNGSWADERRNTRLARRKINALFVCSRNQWRSPTAEHIWRDSPDVNVRARGLSPKAKRVLVETDIAWADVIFVMERRHRSLLLSRFDELVDRDSVHVLDIPDEYQFLDPELIEQLRARAGWILNRMVEGEPAETGKQKGMLHRSTRELKGTAYFEFLPGPYREECWGPQSVFLDEEAFGFIEPIFRRLCPDYDHYAFMLIERPVWNAILGELDDLAGFLGGSPDDAALCSRMAFYFETTKESFFAAKERNVDAVREMILELTEWVRAQLETHEMISLLGL